MYVDALADDVLNTNLITRKSVFRQSVQRGVGSEPVCTNRRYVYMIFGAVNNLVLFLYHSGIYRSFGYG